jgi:tetratricopeptide (TPR) repeat protein
MASDPPKVLISYSHDCPQHAQHVLELANRLRADGIDCMIDQYVLVPEEGWPRWMDKQIRDSDFVAMVCTETYYQRVMGEETPGLGRGVRWEGHLIYEAIYQADTRNRKFIPVVLEASGSHWIPPVLRSTNYYDLGTNDGYEELYRRLTDQPRAIKPELGKPRSLPPAERKSEGTAGWEVVLSNFPEHNPFFTGRERVLAQLQQALAAQGRAVLSGLGGVGKTQTSVEYAQRHLAEYAYAFWAKADSRESLVSGYVTIAGLLKMPESKDRDQTLAVDAVKRWLNSHEDWLLILDNADDLGTVREFIPPGKNGHVLLTTRAWAVGTMARRVEIQEMGAEEGALFVLRRAKYIAEDAPLNIAIEADQATAKEIAKQLDGLPLALDQAAAYIEETACGLSGYLGLYRTHGPELLRLRGTLASDHPDPVATTWALSFENIEKANPAAAELLRFCAFLSPDGIPEEVFSGGAPELGPVLGAVFSDAFALNSSISEILKYSLLRRDPNARTLKIHRLVQAVLRQTMDEASQRMRAERLVRAVDRAFPSPKFSNWPVGERLLPQARACVELINEWNFEFPEAARLLHNVGFYLYERGRYTDVEQLSKRALGIFEKALGPEHAHVASSLNNLAAFYVNQGQYAKAEALYQRALGIREKTLGPEHLDVATSLNGLAELYQTQGQYAKAEPLYERALGILGKALGPEHPNVATSLNNLAVLYRTQGQYAKAEFLYQRALEIREKTLGPEHPHVGMSLDNLAWLYYSQGQYAKAQPLNERALGIFEKALGPEHTDVATSLNNLAELYRVQGQYAKAQPLYKRALGIREKTLGPEHPHVGMSLDNLAALYYSQGQYAKAQPLTQRALKILEKALGPEHPDVAMSLYNLAGLCEAQGRYTDAEPLYKRALEIWGKALGPEHPHVEICREKHALLLRNLDRFKEAESLETRPRAIRAKGPGRNDPCPCGSGKKYKKCHGA